MACSDVDAGGCRGLRRCRGHTRRCWRAEQCLCCAQEAERPCQEGADQGSAEAPCCRTSTGEIARVEPPRERLRSARWHALTRPRVAERAARRQHPPDQPDRRQPQPPSSTAAGGPAPRAIPLRPPVARRTRSRHRPEAPLAEGGPPPHAQPRPADRPPQPRCPHRPPTVEPPPSCHRAATEPPPSRCRVAAEPSRRRASTVRAVRVPSVRDVVRMCRENQYHGSSLRGSRPRS